MGCVWFIASFGHTVNEGKLPPLTMISHACHGIFNFSCHEIEIIISFNHCKILRFWSAREKSMESGWLSVVFL